ncbi:MAG: T9SS type A sorting domain-containing protein, partial [Flavobacteriales bacterium]|nr:T9SS type A sorting domain-containing protein [Flavobacteriales bacterium]
IVFVSIYLGAQAQKTILVEQVTSASCGPCAAVNPAFNNLLDANLGDVVVIKYQRGGGNYIDPMFDFNPNEVNGRVVSYYQTTSFPNVWIDGIKVQGGPSAVSQSTIDQGNGATQTYDIQLTHELFSNNDSIRIEGTYIAMKDFQNPEDVLLRAYTAVVEREVNYSSAPGTNGEKDFTNVMRKMIPHQNGHTIGKQFNGDTVKLSWTYGIDKTEIDPTELYAVTWVQSSPTKEVFQAANSTEKSTLSTNSAVKEDVDLKLYPSPTDNQLFVELNNSNSNTRGNIYNSLGEIVNSFQLNSSRELINTTALSNGIYFLSVDTGSNDTITKKFVVNHK